MNPSIEDILKEILTAIGVPYSSITQTEVAGQTIYSIKTEDDGRILMGPHGDGVHALDYLVKKIAERRQTANITVPQETNETGLLFLVDINDHRVKQIKDLQMKAFMMAERARSFQYDVELNPMSGYERLIIHTTLQDALNIKTESLGEGRNRRVVIKYVA